MTASIDLFSVEKAPNSIDRYAEQDPWEDRAQYSHSNQQHHKTNPCFFSQGFARFVHVAPAGNQGHSDLLNSSPF